MSYDRRGHRRLGAVLGGGGGGRPERVVDLPDLVGHPAFPTTLEALVAASGGAVMDAARAALEREEEVEACLVQAPRLLAPFFPRSLRGIDVLPGERRIAGPGEELPWPPGAAWVEHEPRVVAVLGGWGAPLEGAPGPRVLGYALASDWVVRDGSGDPRPREEAPPIALGPCLVTGDEVDPQTVFLTVRVDGEEVAKGNLNGAARDLLALVASLVRTEGLGRGDAVAVTPFPPAGTDPARRLWPSATVEVEAEGLGALRNAIRRAG
ncbi:MAG TPA: fumarylacetoacetate hydrolase family protein [Actinomycetota bacterium]|nr:fumarylacetoacetate hydrolase family protein [Actinomycetota bacterium]